MRKPGQVCPIDQEGRGIQWSDQQRHTGQGGERAGAAVRPLRSMTSEPPVD